MLTTLSVVVASVLGGLWGVVHDGILDGEELCRVCLTADTDEKVAGRAVDARHVESMTDNADHSRFTHPDIFAARRQPAVSINAQHSSTGTQNALTSVEKPTRIRRSVCSTSTGPASSGCLARSKSRRSRALTSAPVDLRSSCQHGYVNRGVVSTVQGRE